MIRRPGLPKEEINRLKEERQRVFEYFDKYGWDIGIQMTSGSVTDWGYRLYNTNMKNISIYIFRTTETSMINVNIYIHEPYTVVLMTSFSYIQKVNLTDCIYENCFDHLL